MSRKVSYSRRGFLGMVGSSSLLGLAGPFLRHAAGSSLPITAVRFAYVACDVQNAGRIDVFRVSGRSWKLLHSVASESPSSLALSPDQMTLFVANRRQTYEGRPTASVEAYRIDPRSGNLRLLSREPLALSAVGPEHVAVSPDGKYLVVSVTDGGAYNLLPIGPEGKLGCVTILRKEVGASIHPEWQRSARPQQVTFDGKGRLISSDLGCDRINVFELESDSLFAKQRNPVEPGSGPATIELSPSTSALFVGGALDGTITAYAYDEAKGRVLSRIACAKACSHSNGSSLHAMAIHPAGELVVASWSGPGVHGVSSWRFRHKEFSFELGGRLEVRGAIKALKFLPTGDALVAADTNNGVIASLRLDEASGHLSWSTQLAEVPRPSAICFTYL